MALALALTSEQDFRKRLTEFTEFLVRHGAEVVPPHQWEILRFQSAVGIGIVYFNARGGTKLTEACADAWACFTASEPWRGQRRMRHSQSKTVYALLIERDGDGCFLCGKPLGDDMTREHLLAVVDGGTNHLNNLVLAHAVCNHQMGALSIMAKIRMREARLAIERGDGTNEEWSAEVAAVPTMKCAGTSV